MASAKQLNDQKDPAASDSSSMALWSENGQPGSDCSENQETTKTSLIEDWIDA